jgi:parallel beta-helix repeat protein
MSLKGQLYLPIILILLAVGFIPLAQCARQIYAGPMTITVPDDYASIQAAINASSPGDTVFVRNGTYYEHVDINKTITLVGESKDSAIIDGNFSDSYHPVVDINDWNVTVQDFTVQNGTYGLWLDNASNAKLRNVAFRSNQLDFSYSPIQNDTADIDASNTVDGKPIYFWINKTDAQVPSDAGLVVLINCTNVTVRGATLTKDIMTLINVENCSLENVTFSTATYNFIETNGVYNCTFQNNYFDNSTQGGIRLMYCNYSSFVNNTLSNLSGYDAFGLFGSFNSISENMLMNNSGGNALDVHGSFNTVSKNTIRNNNYVNSGIHLTGDNNLATSNKVVNNTNGIVIASNFNNVSNNDIEGNFLSQIEIYGNCSFNTITGNRVIGNMLGNTSDFENGIIIDTFSHNNTIVQNLVEANHYGIYVMPETGGNVIFHNNIVNNFVEASVHSHLPNVWDNGYPSGGNHWGDYSGSDSNHDGIGDTPYILLYDTNIDHYPLMTPITIPEFQLLLFFLLFALSTGWIASLAVRKGRKSLTVSKRHLR